MKHLRVLGTLTTSKSIASLPTATLLIAAMTAVLTAQAAAAVPDPVLQWVGIMNTTVINGATTPLVTTRVVALVSASVFDAVNGINPRYQSLHVRFKAPGFASQRAAAVQAAYAMLVKIYPTQIDSLTAQRDASMSGIASGESAKAIAAGIGWGEKVADSVWEWRSLDGYASPTAVLWRRQHRRYAGGSWPLATNSLANRVRSRSADCHHGALGADSTRAVPVAATVGSQRSQLPCRLQRSQNHGCLQHIAKV